MHIRSLSTTLALVGVVAFGCDDGKKEQSPGEVLARDSALASDLKAVDTSNFAEAADVAMAFNPDSALEPVVPPAPTPAATRPAPTRPAATPTPVPAVPMRVDRNRSPAPAPGPAPRPPLRPAPATIHADPVPSHPMSPADARERVPTMRRTSAPAAPSATAILERVPGATLPEARTSEPCASPAPADQRRCLMAHLARSDVSLDRTYQALISDLKRQAGTPPGAAEPPSVQDLRKAQRAWLVYRDTECRRRNRGKEGALWAPMRAQCLAEFSGVREAELARARRQ